MKNVVAKSVEAKPVVDAIPIDTPKPQAKGRPEIHVDQRDDAAPSNAEAFQSGQETAVVGIGRKTTTQSNKPEATELSKKMKSTPRPVLVRRGYGFEVFTQGKAVADGYPGVDLAKLDGLHAWDRPAVIETVSRVGGPFTVVLPPNFKPGGSYRIRPVVAPAGQLGDVANKIVTSKAKGIVAANEIQIVLDAARIGEWDPEKVAESRAKSVDGVSFAGVEQSIHLGEQSRGWVKALKTLKTAPPPVVTKSAPASSEDHVVRARHEAVVRARADLLGRLGALDDKASGVGSMKSLLEARLPSKASDTSASLETYEVRVRQFTDLVDELVRRLTPDKAAPAKKKLPPTKVSDADRAFLDAVTNKHEALTASVTAVVNNRPDLFAGPDSATGQSFAEALAEFVEGGYVAKGEVIGLATMLERFASRDFNGHIPGYSHTHGLNKSLVMNHPGLILKLIQHAKDDKPFETKGAYPDDGNRKLSPGRLFSAPFERVGLGGVLGYERGLLHATVEDLAPHRGDVHPDLLAGRSPLAGIGVQKLTGEKVRYNYAFKLQTGDDLVEALESQGGRGLAMGDIRVTWDNGRGAMPHFPFFSEYDPDTRTVRLDNFGGRTYRVSVEGMRLHDVAFYHYGDGTLDKFLTPERETLMGDKHPGLKRGHTEPLD